MSICDRKTRCRWPKDQAAESTYGYLRAGGLCLMVQHHHHAVQRSSGQQMVLRRDGGADPCLQQAQKSLKYSLHRYHAQDKTAVIQGNEHFAGGLPVGLVMPSALLAYEWSRLDVSVRVCPQRLVRYASLESDISSIPHACVMD